MGMNEGLKDLFGGVVRFTVIVWFANERRSSVRLQPASNFPAFLERRSPRCRSPASPQAARVMTATTKHANAPLGWPSPSDRYSHKLRLVRSTRSGQAWRLRLGAEGGTGSSESRRGGGCRAGSLLALASSCRALPFSSLDYHMFSPFTCW